MKNSKFKLRMKVTTFIFLLAVLLSFVNVFAAEKNDFDLDATALSDTFKKVKWHGYYEFEYWDKQNDEHTFDAHKVTLWMGVPVNNKVFVSTEFEYEHFPRLDNSGTASNGGSGELKLDSAQLRITPFKNFATYMGVFYVPFGIEYFSYPGHKNKLITRPKVMKSGGIIPGTWSDVGIGFNYIFDGIGQTDFFALNGDPKNGGISRDSSAGGNENKSVGTRLQLDKIIEGLNVGASFVTGKWDESDRNTTRRVGTHFKVDSAKITGIAEAPLLLAEYVLGLDENASSVVNEDKKVNGYYFQASSRLHDYVELVARFGQYDNDTEKSENKKTETSIGLILHLLDNFQIKGEYQINSEQGTGTDNNAAIVQVVAFW